MTPRTVVLVCLIVVAALTRLLPHPDNFAPITAMAVFAAACLGNRRAALLVPLLALLLSDLGKEILYRNGLGRDWGLYRGMWVVYGTTALVVLVGRLAHGSRSPVVILGTTLAGSGLFFAVTNFAVWAGGTLYPRTAEGLGACYVAALPFFRNAVLGDLAYATALFGVWALAHARYPALAPSPGQAGS